MSDTVRTRTRLTRWVPLFAMLMAALGPALVPHAWAQSASAIIVMDGSNSMNARLLNDRMFKFVTVREALRSALPKLTVGTEIGLAAFGARRVNDCSDAEVIVPPVADASPVLIALDKFQPRGFSPVVLSLRMAAKALPSSASKASILLVLDDLASCRGEDPCAVAAELKRQNPALAIHVVGLGLRPVDAEVLSCMVRQTGGQLFNAPDGPAVAPAIEQALALVSVERRQPSQPPAPVLASPPTAAKRPPAERRTPAVPVVDTRAPGLHLSARLAEGRPSVAVPVRWQVFRRAETTEQPGADSQPDAVAAAPLVEAVQPTLSRVLPDGRYEVEARAGLVTVRQPFTIASQGPTPVAVTLNAGLLAITAPLAKGDDPAPEAIVTIATSTGDPQRRLGEAHWIGRGGAVDLVVPAGSYRVSAVAGLARVERTVAVGAGATTDVELALGAGRLIVDAGAISEQGGKPQLIIEADDPDNPAGRRELHRAATSRLELPLPAGSYLITLRRGLAEIRERVLIRAAETASRAMSLATTRVRLVSRIGSALPPGLPVSYRIERLDGTHRAVQRWGEAEPVLDLSPGRYRVEARIGAQNAVATREFEVRGGPEGRIELDTAAGWMQLKLAAGVGGHGLGEVYWQVFDDRGEAVWRTGQAEPLLALGAGRYRIRVELRERTFERTVDVRPGDNRVIEVGG